MQNKINGLGWVAAALMAGVMLGTGFQDNQTKIGVVDITKVVEESDFGKAGQAEFNARKASREGILQFIDDNRVLTVEQANRIRELSIKASPTEAEKAELERTKQEVLTAAAKNKELATKPTPTPEERTLMQEYANRAQTMDNVTARWFRDFTNELQAWADNRKVDSLARARVAIQEVAKQQGYTVVFEVGMAPYGANDLSDAALKAMNAKK